ncbi:MAG: IS110 family transposase [Candidatus Omnitrophica bacterium]|nr:IS110 family transposase [Candidatus Omnitrophota bacterium]
MQTNKNIRQFVGLDVHKKTVYGYVMDRDGNKVFEKNFRTDPGEMDTFLLNVIKHDSIIAIESCSCWQFVYDYVSDAGYNVVLAHPVGIAAIKKVRKHTDKFDAMLLADLLRTNMLPQSYAAPWDIRVKRQVTRHRHSLTDIEVQIKNKVHAILLRHGINNLPYDDAFCKSGIAYLQSLDLPSCDRFELDQYLDLIKALQEKKEETTKAIQQLGDDGSSVRLAMTMPGIGHYAATTFVAEVGDIRRFDNGDKVASFAGLVPRVHQSGERTNYGHITKQGNNSLRMVMIQAANIAVMRDPTLKKMYSRLAKKKGHGKAIVAVARRMVTLLYVMLKNNLEYHALQIHKAP